MASGLSGHWGEHGLERLGCTLDGDHHAAIARLVNYVVDGRHALESRRELEPAANLNAKAVRAGLRVRRCEQVALVELPVHGLERGLLHGVTDEAVLEQNQSVSRGERQRRLGRSLLERDERRVAAGGAVDHALHLEVFTSDGTGLVEAADVDTAGVGDAEGFGAEDGVLGESHERSVDSHGQLHGQFGRHDRDHEANELTLRRAESSAEDDAERTVVRGTQLGVAAVGLGCSGLEHLGTTEDDVVAIGAVDVKDVLAVAQLDVLLEQRRALTGKHGLTLEDDGALEDDEHEEREERVVPVLVEHPQADAEDLEDEEGCDGVLEEEIDELGLGNVELVLAKGAESELDVLLGS
ncbi:hypothetical protein L1887_48414 [Cichorium endivia]|nr:hypothetical protein L1887_48414 [Cichorium endivia]